MAERLVETMARRDGLPAVIVNPSTPIGPRDVKPTPTGRIIVEAACGRIPAFVDTGLNLVHVDDVAAGHLAALRRGEVGERYILGGENVLLSAMLADIAAIVGRRPPTLRAPRALIYPLAYAAEFLARFSGREPFVTVRRPEHVAGSLMFFDDAKARRELGYASRPYREGLARRRRLVPRARISAMTVILAAFIPRRHLGVSAPRQRRVLALPRARRRAIAWTLDAQAPGAPAGPPSVAAVIPARDEAEVIGTKRRLAPAAGFSGAVRDRRRRRSELGRHGARRASAAAEALGRLEPSGSSRAPRRRRAGPASSGRCVRASRRSKPREHPPEFVLFTDADIAYRPRRSAPSRRHRALDRQRARLADGETALRQRAERLLAPAFVFFFQKLYPFAWVNDPGRRTAAAAGGCMLVRREALTARRRPRDAARRADRRLRARRAR